MDAAAPPPGSALPCAHRREKVCEALSLISEAVGPMFVMMLLHKRAAANKNPKVGRVTW